MVKIHEMHSWAEQASTNRPCQQTTTKVQGTKTMIAQLKVEKSCTVASSSSLAASPNRFEQPQVISLSHKTTSVKKKEANQTKRDQPAKQKYMPLMIMASAVWWTWCTSLGNCVKVEADKPALACPSDCQCLDNYQKISCNGKHLRTFPPEIPTKVESLSLSENNIRDVNRKVFQRFAKLKILKLDENKIRSLPINVFFHIPTLQTLDLSENKLTKVPKKAFAYLRSLRELKLRNNPITQILGYDFLSFSRTLVHLDLGELRHLTYVSGQALNGLNNVQTLQMDSCNLLEIPFLGTLSALQELDLSSNKLTWVKSSDFSGLGQLKVISLDHCNIRNIDDEAFNDQQLLKSLNLASNSIASLGVSLFDNNKNLQTLQLETNPWLCNCDLLPLVGYLSYNSLCADPKQCSDAVCTYPAAYKGMPIKDLNRIDDLPCAALMMNTEAETSLNASVGESLKIPCPTLSSEEERQVRKIEWIMPNGQSLQHGRYKVGIKKLDSGALNFTKVTLEDKGLYTCSVKNRSNEVTNSTIYLNVTAVDQPVLSTFTTFTTTIIGPEQHRPVENDLLQTTTTRKPPQQIKTTQKLPSRQLTSNKQKVVSTTTARNNFDALTKPQGAIKKLSTTKAILPRQIVEESPPATIIIIGCFIGLTLIAALLLVLFYKIRKRNFYYPASRQSVDSESEAKYEMNENGHQNGGSESPNHICNKSYTDYTNSSPHQCDKEISMNGKSTLVSSDMWLRNGNTPTQALDSGFHLLPPPLEEMHVKEEQNRGSAFHPPRCTIHNCSFSKNSTLTTTNVKKLNCPDSWEDSGDWKATQKQNPNSYLQCHGSGNQTHKEILTHIQHSCQEVALKRQTVDKQHLKDIGTKAGQFKFQSVSTPSPRQGSCGSLLCKSDASSSDGSSIPKKDDLNLSIRCLMKNQHENDKNGCIKQARIKGRSKTKIIVKMKSLEGLTEQKETEI